MQRAQLRPFASPLFLAIALVGCGGGGGGTYNAPPAAINVNFSAPAMATAISYGQALAVTWSSANATSCTASASGAAAGTFTGNQPVTGTQTIVPAGPGSYTYMLMCSGPAGSMTASTPTVTVNPSILASLASVNPTTIGPTGSATDPTQGYNPYGLTIAPATAGLITAGDLVVCNFNQGGNANQGTGMNIVGLHPSAGSTPYSIAQSASLLGCSALMMLPDDS
ncbi:MAG: hypothetical protein ACLPV8_14275 [Steroidobacteraceae bacterium]